MSATVATPPTSVTVRAAWPLTVNTTVPVGTPPPGAAAWTLAWSVPELPFGTSDRLDVVAAWPRVKRLADELLDRVRASPEYAAMIECTTPAPNSGTVNVACRPETEEVPRRFVPSKKVTTPPNGIDEARPIVAVSETGWPTTGEDVLMEIVVEVASVATDWPTDAPDLRKFASPKYTAWIACHPMPRFDVENDADPATRATTAIGVDPSWNVTVPVGIAPIPATDAVNVTVSPIEAEGFDEATVRVDEARPTTSVDVDEIDEAYTESPE